MGRRWETADGNLFASTIVRVSSKDPPAASLAFVAALAAYDTAQKIAPEAVIQIKWPNDLLTADGAKFCGMLLERSGDAVIIGIGINLFTHPPGLERAVTDLRTAGAHPPHAQAVVEILGEAMHRWLQRWRNGGVAAILKDWQERAHPPGTALIVNLPGGDTLKGEYAGLDEDGALQLRLANGEIHAIHAADVFLI